MSEKYDIARHFWAQRKNKNYALTSINVSELFSIDLPAAQEILSKLRVKDRILDMRAKKGREQEYFLRNGITAEAIDALQTYTVEQLLAKRGYAGK